MKKISLALSIFLCALTGCKKNNSDNQPPAPVQSLNVSKLSPLNVTEGLVATINGTDLGTSTADLTIYFQDKQASIISVEPTEIKILVPKTSSGKVTFKKNGVAVTTPADLTFTYYTLTELNGDVSLFNQGDVDDLVKAHTGQRLQIKGNLTIGQSNVNNNIKSIEGLSDIVTSVSGLITLQNIKTFGAPFLKNITAAGGLSIRGCDFTSLSLDALQSFSGDFSLFALSKLTSLHVENLTSVNNLQLSLCALLTTITGLNTIKSAASVKMSSIAATSINLENLTDVTSNGVEFSFIKNLTSVNLKSLARVNGQVYVYACIELSQLNFKALKSVSGRLTIYGSNITDLSGFEAVETLGALNLTHNASLTNIQGLAHLTSLDLPGITGTVTTGVIMGLGGVPASMGGITIEANPMLTSLNGLQNIKNVPIANISNNALLNDLCPLKSAILKLKTSPEFNYTEYNVPAGRYYYNRTVAALNLWGNGSNIDTEDELRAVELCN